jgi:hypothetical protein
MIRLKHSTCCFNKGAVLILCLLLLAALSMLALAAASDQILQARITVNTITSSNIEASSDAGLSWGESWLFGLGGKLIPDNCETACGRSEVIKTDGFYPLGSDISGDWWSKNAYSAGIDPVTGATLNSELAQLHAGSSWIVEEIYQSSLQLADVPPTDIGYYRILTRGRADPGSMFSITESIVARPWGDDSWQNAFPDQPGSVGFCQNINVQIPCGRLAWRKVR